MCGEWQLTFAHIIHAASEAFLEIGVAPGEDLRCLLFAVGTQCKLWQKMRIPLVLKTIVLLVQAARA